MRLMDADAFLRDLSDEGCDVCNTDPICTLYSEFGYSFNQIEQIIERQKFDNRIEKALDIAYQYSQNDGAHHKAWVIDQMVRALLGEGYEAWVEKYKHDDEDDPDAYYDLDEGITP